MAKISGKVYLWLAIIIFGVANAVTRKITEIGALYTINGRNSISLCNVLFVGNLCALILLIIIYRQQLKPKNLKKISQKKWFKLTIVSMITGAIAPALIFRSLELTMVNNVVLISRLEPVLTLFLSIWLLGDRVNSWGILGAIVSFVGVILSILLPSNLQGMLDINNYLSLGLGEIFTIIASIAIAISTIINKAHLHNIPLGIYSTYRTAIGTIVFFFIALIFYGHHHFMDVFSPILWQWMLIYGPVIVVLGQSFWIKGLRHSSISQASLIASFTPVVAIIASYFILKEIPTFAQYIGGSVIFIGIIISQFSIQKNKYSQQVVEYPEQSQEIDNKIGFKGL